MSAKTFFISGHLDLTETEFNEHYQPKLKMAVATGGYFIVGDSRGADAMAQSYLGAAVSEDGELHARILVYHIGRSPRNNKENFKTIGNFKTDLERDEAMTRDSTDDILWVRPEDEQRKRLGAEYNPLRVSGTMKNKLRRMFEHVA